MLMGHQSWEFKHPPTIQATATVVGPEEGKGPMQNEFDVVHSELMLGQDSWEKAEKVMLEEAAHLALDKAGLMNGQVHFFVGGDLMNQIISSTFAARTLNIPYIGIFGACSTSMEGLALSAMILDAGGADYVLTGTCSHNCSVEKQFRYPTEYGSQKPPSAQFTVSGAGCAVLSRINSNGPKVTAATIGRVIDMGISDPFNMGAAMAPAAVDTLQAHFRDLGTQPEDYDVIITGDLGAVGYEMALELMHKHSIPIEKTTYMDCGMMIYDRARQPVQAGGSGCGCSAVVTYGYFMKLLTQRKLKRILVIATGALLSPLSFQQGETIPCIAHAVSIEAGGSEQ
jgi:stage V sporulation protein AD